MGQNGKIAELKQQLHSVSKHNFNLKRNVHSLHTREHVLKEEIEHLRIGNEYSHFQINELSGEISQLKCQKTIIEVCAESEKAKINVQLYNLDKHKNGYDVLFNIEKAISAKQRERQKQKELEEKEKQRQKMEKILEKNEQQAKEAAAIEDECLAIERECNVILKRNKAIMLQLRRKLIETDRVRRELMKNIATNNCKN